MTSEEGGYFRDVCESVGFALITVDRDLRIVYWNSQAVRQFGRGAAEMRGRSILEVFEEDRRAEARGLFEKVIATRAPGDLEVKHEAEAGRRRTYAVVVSPIMESGGECVGVSVCMRDISERKRLSQELARSRRMVSLGHMAEGVAHNFNNILTEMLTKVEVVLPSDSPRELRRTLRQLMQIIDRAERITKRLLAFAECEYEQPQLAELNAVAGEFIERLKPQAEQAGINLVTNLAEVTSGQFEAQRLAAIFESLTSNAFDAMTPGGTLTIGMASEGDQAVITVTDTGCGIPEDVRDRLFEPFFTTKGALGGGSGAHIGLGLAVVHGLVSELGGTIQLTSKTGEGTKVEVRLPLQRPPPDGLPGITGPPPRVAPGVPPS